MYIWVIHLRWYDRIGMISLIRELATFPTVPFSLPLPQCLRCSAMCGPFSLSTNNIRTKMIPSSQFINFRAKVGKNMKFTTFALFQWNLHFPNVLLNSISTFFSGKLKLSIDSNYPALFSNLKSNNNITYSSLIILILVVSKTK